MVNRRSTEKLVSLLTQAGVRDTRVLQAIAELPRDLFVEEALRHKAWDNTALPIGQGQTISQPYIVAKMTELLLADSQPESVLEIGTGSGYQTAVLAKLVPHVMSVERIKALQWQARRRLQKLDLHNVSMRHGDGWQGWRSKGPYAAILVTAAATNVPTALLEQLADGGRMIIPVGEQQQQSLWRITRNGNEFIRETMEAVRFVPLVPGDLA